MTTAPDDGYLPMVFFGAPLARPGSALLELRIELTPDLLTPAGAPPAFHLHLQHVTALERASVATASLIPPLLTHPPIPGWKGTLLTEGLLLATVTALQGQTWSAQHLAIPAQEFTRRVVLRLSGKDVLLDVEGR